MDCASWTADCLDGRRGACTRGSCAGSQLENSCDFYWVVFPANRHSLVIAGKRTAFEQYEAQLYEELQGIIGETGVLHTALDRTLRLEIEAYQKALDPISSTTQRLEHLGAASSHSPHSTGTPASSVAGYGAGTGYTSQQAGYPSQQAGYQGQQSQPGTAPRSGRR